MDTMGEALTLFRQRYGIAANPEDYLELWQECLEEVKTSDFLESELCN